MTAIQEKKQPAKKAVSEPKPEKIEQEFIPEPTNGDDTTPEVKEPVTTEEVLKVRHINTGDITGFSNPAYNTATTPVNVEEKILGFLEGKKGNVKLNLFLKSLFPVSKNAPTNIGTSKYIGGILEKMVAENKIIIAGNNHKRLGKTYYPESKDQRSAQYNLDTLDLTVTL